MSNINVQNIRISSFDPLDPPKNLKSALPINNACIQVVRETRETLRNALVGSDNRLVVIAGPCSIHDEQAAYEYAEKFAELKRELESSMILIMRVYFEKPRTTVGWKGLINDPHLDGSCDVNTGLRKARTILRHINTLGVPCATEFLDPIVPPYMSDLVSWVAIGARTTESQTHREMASGLSMPVGFKNATDGGLQVAIDAMISAQHPHAFLGIDQHGQSAVVRTAGNPDVHLVLRGGGGKPNFSRADIAYANVRTKDAGFDGRRIMVDCSHGNSNKDYTKQTLVLKDLIDQRCHGEKNILGVMLESHLVSGNQALKHPLVYGKSITDGCIGWDTTVQALREAHEKLR